MYKPAITAGIIFAGLAVLLGAFAAHGLAKTLTPEKIEVFQKGVTYQFYHSFALILLGIVWSAFPFKSVDAAMLMFISGIVLFSGTLYVYPLLEARNIHIPTIGRLLTPLGGLCFIGGWVLFVTGVLKTSN
ncbi:MAG: DUF423 domain-containing protein [Taibaiella sp.]|nr:DUF423 domain-containing protein [Taibaiella sp.]